MNTNFTETQIDQSSTPGTNQPIQPQPKPESKVKAKASRKKDDSPFALEIAALEEKLAKARERQREAIRKQQKSKLWATSSGFCEVIQSVRNNWTFTRLKCMTSGNELWKQGLQKKLRQAM